MIHRDAAEKTLRARTKRAVSELSEAIVAGDAARQADLTAYLAELQGKLAELANADDQAAHDIGMWCRENHERHIATCPSSLKGMVRVDPATGMVLSVPEPAANPGPTQVIEVAGVVAPSALGNVG